MSAKPKSMAVGPIEATGRGPVLGRATDQLCINTIRTLAMDAVQQANSGHPGTPMALAPVAYTLWQHFLRFDPEDPIWPNRDRFVLSNGHASMLLYALLHLTGVKAVNAKHERLSLQFEVKRRGPVVDLAAVKMDFRYDDWFPKEPNVGYETLIYDVMIGDPTLFMRADMVEQTWRVVQPVLDAWAKSGAADLPIYPAGSSGPSEADAVLDRGGRRWRHHDPYIRTVMAEDEPLDRIGEAILAIAVRHEICSPLHIHTGIAHCNAKTTPPEHRNIIAAALCHPGQRLDLHQLKKCRLGHNSICCALQMLSR
jgi:hypothetical protein